MMMDVDTNLPELIVVRRLLLLVHEEVTKFVQILVHSIGLS